MQQLRLFEELTAEEQEEVAARLDLGELLREWRRERRALDALADELAQVQRRLRRRRARRDS